MRRLPCLVAALLVAAPLALAGEPEAPPAAPRPGLIARLLRLDPQERSGLALGARILRLMARHDPPAPLPDQAGMAHALETDRRGRPEVSSAVSRRGHGLYEHMLQAATMNAERLSWYAAHAGDQASRSRWVSRLMILGETGSLPALALTRLDEPALVHDAIPLQPLPPASPPCYRGVASRAQWREVRALIRDYRAEGRRLQGQGDLASVARLTRATIAALEARERAWGCHFAMTRHVLGTVGLAALRGDQHRVDAPHLVPTSRAYVGRLLRFSFLYALLVDREAQPLHARGLGIVVNEFTDQAFLQAWEASRR